MRRWKAYSALWLLGLAARLLRPVIDEIVRQQWEEDEARRAAMTPADVEAYIRSVMPTFDQIDRPKESMH